MPVIPSSDLIRALARVRGGAAALAGVCAAGLFLASPEVRGDTPPADSSGQSEILAQMQDTLTSLAKTVEPSVVNIKTTRLTYAPDDQSGGGDSPTPPLPIPGRRPRGGNDTPNNPMPQNPGVPHFGLATGSGVIISPDGYILTNQHVVAGAEGGVVTVTLVDGQAFRGKVWADSRSDLAVVKIDASGTPLHVAKFADSSTVVPGQWAIAVGSPFGLSNSLTVGVISAIGRHQSIPGATPAESRYYPELIQTDAAINPGNSGGPLFNINGEVVGINVAIELPVDSSAGIGFAIPSDVAQSVFQMLIAHGSITRGYLGLSPDDLSPALRNEFDQQTGAFVTDVREATPAGRAGIRAGDIITYYDKKPIDGEIHLRSAIAGTTPGTKIRIDWVRAGVPMHSDVTIEAVPTSGDIGTPPARPVHRAKLGLTVRDVSAQDRQALGLPADTTGVFVTAVQPGSPAEGASDVSGVMLTGTVIQSIGVVQIHNIDDFQKAVNAIGDRSEVTLVLLYSADGDVHQSAVQVPLY